MDMYKLMGSFIRVISMPNINYFSVSTLQTACIADSRDGILNPDHVQVFVETELNKLVRQGWIVESILKVNEISLYSKTDIFDCKIYNYNFDESFKHLFSINKLQPILTSFSSLPNQKLKEIFSLKNINYLAANKSNSNEITRNIDSLMQSSSCLYSDGTEYCDEIAEKNRKQIKPSLLAISDNRYIYKITKDHLVDICKLDETHTHTEQNFFCDKHNIELFDSLGDTKQVLSEQQIFLSAYKLVSNEIYNKKQALSFYIYDHNYKTRDNLDHTSLNYLINSTLIDLECLYTIKSFYDNSLQKQNFSDIRCVLFRSKKDPNMAFSGLYKPNYDYFGNPLKDTINQHNSMLSIISIPTFPGWIYVIAWHKENSEACNDFISSLSELVENKDSIEDALFELAIVACKEPFFSPKWWEESTPEIKRSILEKSSYSQHAFSEPLPFKRNLNGIIDWNFEIITSNY
ncbi:hypothetical protein [Pseudoalteromonas sp. NGC95]|uniref:hypothetical protein n=1 Tax=Pseudoalteromonas sp. NGC95 TaxID=2792051 RepID=UPI0018CFC4E9|nr:hypothetical protein [Pseudoalteromonas sp. NGC95]MBH0018709.1 hypothetical protein [Pseudoalteromonas sp. NGC95]